MHLFLPRLSFLAEPVWAPSRLQVVWQTREHDVDQNQCLIEQDWVPLERCTANWFHLSMTRVRLHSTMRDDLLLVLLYLQNHSIQHLHFDQDHYLNLLRTYQNQCVEVQLQHLY